VTKSKIQSLAFNATHSSALQHQRNHAFKIAISRTAAYPVAIFRGFQSQTRITISFATSFHLAPFCQPQPSTKWQVQDRESFPQPKSWQKPKSCQKHKGKF
jgi:hypothetical protein